MEQQTELKWLTNMLEQRSTITLAPCNASFVGSVTLRTINSQMADEVCRVVSKLQLPTPRLTLYKGQKRYVFNCQKGKELLQKVFPYLLVEKCRLQSQLYIKMFSSKVHEERVDIFAKWKKLRTAQTQKGREYALYRKVYQPSHPRADIYGLVNKHLLVVEQRLGRYLQTSEIVHHKNFCKFDNRDNNLLVMSRSHHQNLPAFQARFIIKKGMYEEFYMWWLDERDKEDPEFVLQLELTRAENATEYLKGKLAEQEKDGHK